MFSHSAVSIGVCFYAYAKCCLYMDVYKVFIVLFRVKNENFHLVMLQLYKWQQSLFKMFLLAGNRLS